MENPPKPDSNHTVRRTPRCRSDLPGGPHFLCCACLSWVRKDELTNDPTDGKRWDMCAPCYAKENPMKFDVAAALSRFINDNKRDFAAAVMAASHFTDQNQEDDTAQRMYTFPLKTTEPQPAPHGHRFTITLPTGNDYVVTVDSAPGWDLNTQEDA